LLDAESTYDLYKILNRKMDELELHSFWKTIVRPYIDILKRQYERGMTINSKELEGHSDRLQTKMDECQNRFLHSNADLIAEMEAKWHFEKAASYKSDRGRNKYLDDPSRKIKFNIQSKPQLGDLLFGLIGLRVIEKTKSGRYKVDEDILKQLAKKNESIKDLLEYNKLAKRKQTCLRFCKNINDKGLLHPSFNITGTVSGRLSERGDTPLLTLDKKFLELMKAMYSRKGYSYLYQDYKAAEPVVTAHFSEDETYKKIARGEGDIYLELVEPIFGKSKASLYDLEDIEGSKEKLKVERKVCKVVQLAASYGATKYSIARNVFGDTGAFSLAQAQKILSSYKRKFAKVYKLEAKLKILYKDAGCLKNGLGRAVLMDKTKDALNRFIQSTAHDCLIMHNIIISRMVEERGLAMYPLHIDTHDSMIWEVKDSQTKEGLKVYSDSLKELNDYLGFSVDFRADAKVGKNFKEILSED